MHYEEFLPILDAPKSLLKATKRKNETSKSNQNLQKIQKIQTPPSMTQNTSKAKNTSDTSKNDSWSWFKPETLRPVPIEKLAKEIPKGSKMDEVIDSDSSTICGSCSKSGEKSVISRCNICNLKCHLDCMIIVQNQKVCDGCKPTFV